MTRMAGKRWSREELVVAFNLYCKISFGQIHNRNPRIIKLAEKLGRSSSSVSWKLANFARLDPALKERGIQGATHGSKAEKDIWDEFHNDWDSLAFISETILAQMEKRSIETSVELTDIDYENLKGKERKSIVKVRVNQRFFRDTIIASYDNKCCITGLNVTELLIASHIIPWSKDKENRMNPRNGLCLNAIHDKAFDRGLISISKDYKVMMSNQVKQLKENEAVQSFLLSYEDREITLPKKFRPDGVFLDYHRQRIFKG